MGDIFEIRIIKRRNSIFAGMDAIFRLEQVSQVAAGLWKEGSSKKVWAFHADMGTGKTTFIHALCQHLGVKSAVSSPTFAIINEYTSPVAGTIFHMDWYRLKNEEEAVNAGVEDSLNSGRLCLVEWPENAAALLPENCFHIYMEMLDAETRRLYVGDRSLETGDWRLESDVR